MSLLRFDPSSALNDDYGVPEHRFVAAAARFEEIREEMAKANPFACDNVPLANPADPLTREPFFRLPETELADYTARREESLLGKIFKVANTIDAKIDAVIVLGNRAFLSGIRAITQASCEPYHNELSRAERGSRPRIYFAGDCFDNDALSAILRRLAIGGYADTIPERRFAVVAIDGGRDAAQLDIALRHCVATFERSARAIASDPNSDLTLAEAIIPIAAVDAPLRHFADKLGCQNSYETANQADDWFSALSAATLMPTALLGLDCMRLLEGAAYINEHFLMAPFAENVVLRYTAINHLYAQQRSCNGRAMNVWATALEPIGDWYGGLLGHHLPSVLQTTWGHHDHTRKCPDTIINHVVVDSWRTDSLQVLAPDGCVDQLDTLPGLTNAALRSAQQQACEAKQPSTILTLPWVDSFTIGQLLQLFMISTSLEMRLASSSK